MRWTPGGTSQDVEDRRDQGGGRRFWGGFGGGGMRIGLGGLLILFILSLIFKQNFFALLGGGSGPHRQDLRSLRGRILPAMSKRSHWFSLFRSYWTILRKPGIRCCRNRPGTPYRHAKLVLFRDYTQSGCGGAESATGPFYCPADEKVYIDLGFYDELKQRFGAPGEFAQAYVLAHEIGHHVQNLTGVESKVRQLQQRNPQAGNQLSVRMELQADCLAGVWAHSTQQRGLLDPADVQSALGAAAAVGDDHIQKMSRGSVQPETFTHGSSEQRMDWFKKGLDSGSIAACNTFIN